MKSNCNHYDQDFVNRMWEFPNMQSHEQKKIDNCRCSKNKSVENPLEGTGLYFQYMDLKIQHLAHQNMIMRTLIGDDGFLSIVMAEFNIIKNLEKAFQNIGKIYKDLFEKDYYKSYDQFLKEIL